MSGLIEIKTNSAEFGRQIEDYAAAALVSIEDAYRIQARLICGELIKRTPPFTGKMLKRMLESRDEQKQIANAGTSMGPFLARAVFNDPEVESMSALAIGKRRVEKDIRRVIFGMRGASMPEENRAPEVFLGQDRNTTHSTGAVNDWGVYQKCQGKDAVRIFAKKSGEVYGVDFERFKENASTSDLRATHNEHRTKRGRVTTAGLGDRVVGRWRWLDILVTKEELVQKYIKLKQGFVGQGKGGWARGFMQLGGRMSARGWVGKHAAKAGLCYARFEKGNAQILIVNQSAWASGGDPDRIMDASLAERGQAIARDIRGRLEGLWGSKARKAAAKAHA